MAQATSFDINNPSFFKKHFDVIGAFLIVAILLLMVVPLSPFMLDLLLVLSIAVSLTILLIGVYVVKPLDFSIFPTVLLLSTIYRLALNVASSRLILINGSSGTNAAGHVIEAFGQFVVGGDAIVGIIVFFILNVINFVVITKGAGRISEVSARFTLDAMPGKQLAIDADLNAGIINDKQAKDRREEIQREADFYGSMDGASKFVRGDAIAGIVITVINIIGGFIIGYFRDGISITDALKLYTIMTIGDGLVAQIPALIVSFAAGIIVTKVNKEANIQVQILNQIFRTYRPLMVVSVIMGVMILIPGLPKVPFLFMSAMIGGLSYTVYRKAKREETKSLLSNKSGTDDGIDKDGNYPIEIPKALDVLEIEVGYDLVDLINSNGQNNNLVKRILALRKQFAQEMGIIIPPIHIQDNLQLRGSEYRLLLKSVAIGQGDLVPHHLLAMESGRLMRTMEGIPTKEPTYGLPAIWIPEGAKEDAIIAGYTVVDLESVMATHLSEVIRKSAWQIFNRQDLQTLLDEFKKTYPKVVQDLIPDILPFGTVLKVIQNLLRERVPVRDLLSILETLASEGGVTKDPLLLTEHVRQSLGGLIASLYKGSGNKLRALTIDKFLEDKFAGAVQMTVTGPEMHVDPVTTQKFIEGTSRLMAQNAGAEGFPIVICSQNVRPHIYQLLEKFVPSVVVVSHNEVAGHVDVEIVGCIREEK